MDNFCTKCGKYFWVEEGYIRVYMSLCDKCSKKEYKKELKTLEKDSKKSKKGNK